MYWRSDYESALEEARITGRPVFVDFTGYTCTNCRWMEANIFPDPEVSALLKRHVLVQLYTDGQGEKYEWNRNFQQERFGTVALPFYTIMTPDAKVVTSFPGLNRDRDVFLQFLRRGLSGYSQAAVPGLSEGT